MPQYTILIHATVQYPYTVDAQCAEEARWICENERNRCALVESDIDELGDEEVVHVFLSEEENYPTHWTSDEDPSADDIRLQHTLSGLPDPTNDELETMFATMGAK